MTDPSRQQVTQILINWSEGDRGAADRLMPLVYDELRQLARSYVQRERSGHTLQATGLVHEAYLRLVDQTVVTLKNRAHFFGVAAQTMRRILVDHARRQRTEKRGGEWEKVEFDEAWMPGASRSVDLVALDEALVALAKLKPEHSQIVELRFFGGLTFEEVAEVLAISPRSAQRGWTMAKAWLRRAVFPELAQNAAGR